MNAYDATTPSEMLTAFLEGDLEGSHEDILFSLLSDDHILRTEMRELIAVNRLARYDAGLMIPPSEWKRNVMKEVAEVGNPKVRKNNRLLPAGWYRNGAILSLGLLLGILGTLATLRLTNDAGTVIALNDVASASTAALPESSAGSSSLGIQAENSHRTVVPNIVNKKNESDRGMSPSPFGLDGPRAMMSDSDDSERANTQDPSVLPGASEASFLRGDKLESAAALTETLVDQDDSSLRSSSTDGLRAINSSLSLPSLPDLNVRRERLEVGFRHSLGSNYPNVALPSTAAQGIGEMSLSLLYSLDEHHAVGLEGGRGNFPQAFRGVENGERVRYEQNPTLLWSGLAYQFIADPILFDGLHPFARLVGGGTTAGPLTRGIVGLRFVPESRVALTAGAEGSLMLYEFQNAWFTSGGLDFTYGISVTF